MDGTYIYIDIHLDIDIDIYSIIANLVETKGLFTSAHLTITINTDGSTRCERRYAGVTFVIKSEFGDDWERTSAVPLTRNELIRLAEVGNVCCHDMHQSKFI